MHQVENIQLIRRCQEGDSVAIEALVRTYKSLTYRLALSILDDPAEADEATQDTFVAVFSKLGSYRGEAKFTTWLYAITLNVCRGRLRQRRARMRLAQVWRALFRLQGEAEPHPEQVVMQNEMDAALWWAIKQLDDRLRETIILRYYHQLSLQEIGQAQGVSERTIRTWLHHAHERLRVLLMEKVEIR